MPSPRYRELTKRATELRIHLLPPDSPTGIYTARQLDRVRGYRLLIHAEVEAFLEDRVRQVANEVVKKWSTDKKLRHSLFSLVAFYLKQEIVSHKLLKEEYAGVRKRLEEAVNEANMAFNKAVSQNNGVREKDILRLLFPVGLKNKEIDSVWLSTIDSFGANRGEVAHSSIKAQQPLDPKNEYQTVELILQGLKDLDGILTKLGR
jgi:hypothetical protein